MSSTLTCLGKYFYINLTEYIWLLGRYAVFSPPCNGRGYLNVMSNSEEVLDSGDKPYECDKCGQKFSNRGTFWSHKKRHENPKPYSCEFCNKTFSHSSHLAVHKRTHTGEIFNYRSGQN